MLETYYSIQWKRKGRKGEVLGSTLCSSPTEMLRLGRWVLHSFLAWLALNWLRCRH